MGEFLKKSTEKQNTHGATANSLHKESNQPVFQFVDNRPEAVKQRKLQETINNHGKQDTNVVQLLGWESLGFLNPRRYLPVPIGYTHDQMVENGLAAPHQQAQEPALHNEPVQQGHEPVAVQQPAQNGLVAHQADAQPAEAVAPPQPPTLAEFREWLTNNAVNVMAAAPAFHFYVNNGDTFRCYWNNVVHINGQVFGLGVNIHLNGHLGSTWLRGGPEGFSLNAQANPAHAPMQQRMRVLMGQNPNPNPQPNQGIRRRAGRGGGRGGRGGGRGADADNWRRR